LKDDEEDGSMSWLNKFEKSWESGGTSDGCVWCISSSEEPAIIIIIVMKFWERERDGRENVDGVLFLFCSLKWYASSIWYAEQKVRNRKTGQKEWRWVYGSGINVLNWYSLSLPLS